jgi:hypothetical protein
MDVSLPYELTAQDGSDDHSALRRHERSDATPLMPTPLDFANGLAALDDRSVRMVMRDNAARLVGLPTSEELLVAAVR